MTSAVEAAGSDPCKLVEALSASPAEPTTPSQVESMVTAYEQLLNAIANALPSESANVASLKDAASSLSEKAKAADFSPDFFSSQEFASVMTSDGVTAGLEEFESESQKCPGAAPTGDQVATTESIPG